MSDTRYAMVVDQKRCIGCHSCVIACKSENNMPSNLSLNVVLTENSNIVDNPVGTRPMSNTCTLDDFNRVAGTPRNDYLTRSCQHCSDAPCVKRCPTGATWQREDGIVMMDPSLCIGCEFCMHDCVYGYGVMRVIVRNPEFSQDFALGDQDTQPNIENTVKKCDFCSHRVDNGEEPFCVTQCPARARYFGNVTDTGSKPALLLAGRVHSSIPPEQTVAGVEQFFYFLKP